LAAQFVKPGSPKRKQEKAVVEKHSAALDPPANGIKAHRIGSDADMPPSGKIQRSGQLRDAKTDARLRKV
jgi:hypothetical protein